MRSFDYWLCYVCNNLTVLSLWPLRLYIAQLNILFILIPPFVSCLTTAVLLFDCYLFISSNFGSSVMWSFRTFLAQLRLFFSFCCFIFIPHFFSFLSFDCYVFIPCIYSSVYVDFTDIEIKCLKACVSWKEMSQRSGSFVNLFLQSPYLPMENTFNSINQHFLPPSFF